MAKQKLPLGMNTPQGRVIAREEARSRVTGQKTGLQKACVAIGDRYPDLETWLEALRPAQVLLYFYTEKMVAHTGFVGYLWLFWKEEE